MKFNLSNLSAVLLASGMLMSTAVTAAPGDASQFGGADTDWSTVDYPKLTDMDSNTDAMGGNIRFTGRVVKATCKVKLTDCSNTDSQNIEFRFTGVADGANQTLANEVEGAADADGTGEAGATGVGIRIYSKNTTTDGLIKLNTQTPQGSSSSAAYVIPGDAATHDFTAAFTAGYAQNGSTVAPGLVKSTASFVVLYE